MVEKHEIGGPGDFAWMSDEELEAIIMRGAKLIEEKRLNRGLPTL